MHVMSHDEIVQLIKRAIYCGKINNCFSAKPKERKIIHHSLNMAKKETAICSYILFLLLIHFLIKQKTFFQPTNPIFNA